MQRKLKIGLSIFVILVMTMVVGCAYEQHENYETTIETTEVSIEVTERNTEPTEEYRDSMETIEEIVEETTKDTVVEATEETITEDKITIETETDKEGDAEQAVEPISLGEFMLTAYCSCSKCCGKYALNRPLDEYGNEIVYGSIGVRLIAGISIAVDPHVIPYESEVIINGHTYTAHDTGGAIKGNRIDIYFDDHQEAVSFGVQYAEVFIVVD